MCVRRHYLCKCCKQTQTSRAFRTCVDRRVCSKTTVIVLNSTLLCYACSNAHHSMLTPCSMSVLPTVIIMIYERAASLQTITDALNNS
jgi:hypothetical protein